MPPIDDAILFILQRVTGTPQILSYRNSLNDHIMTGIYRYYYSSCWYMLPFTQISSSNNVPLISFDYARAISTIVVSFTNLITVFYFSTWPHYRIDTTLIIALVYDSIASSPVFNTLSIGGWIVVAWSRHLSNKRRKRAQKIRRFTSLLVCYIIQR